MRNAKNTIYLIILVKEMEEEKLEMTISTRQKWKTEESYIFTYDFTTSTNSFFGHFLLFKSRIICLFVFFLLYRTSSQNTLFKYNFFLGYFWGRTFTSNTLTQQLLFIIFTFTFLCLPNLNSCYIIPVIATKFFPTPSIPNGYFWLFFSCYMAKIT